jgi:UDP-N-acetylmuramoyl-tripeptide--D-alanyl-D-alanine ligase
MITARLSQLAGVSETRLIRGDAAFRGVSTDSRTIEAGALFVALRGERFDGHDFAQAAVERGAAALLVERELDHDVPQLVVLDTLHALGDFARWHRGHCRARVIGITGSNGKTSVKTLLAAILEHVGPTHVNAGNLNNEIGLPLSLLRLADDARFAVLEMGAGKPGDIDYLARIAHPDIALVNNVAPAHLERMGSEQGVAETKGAIYTALPDDGIAVVNADDRFARYFTQRAGARRVVRFGLGEADVRADHIVPGATSRFVLEVGGRKLPVALPLAGMHNVQNALAAAALAHAAGATPEQIVAGLESARGVAGRLTRHELEQGVTLIDDSYNANPGSTRAAIDTLALEPGRRWLVLGTMAELGPDGERLHAEVGRAPVHGRHARFRGECGVRRRRAPFREPGRCDRRAARRDRAAARDPRQGLAQLGDGARGAGAARRQRGNATCCLSSPCSSKAGSSVSVRCSTSRCARSSRRSRRSPCRSCSGRP